MATQVIMPKLSPTMEEGQLSRWLKKEGDKVSMGEPLAEIDTDKATMEMQALSNGVLRKILIKEGESAPLGQIIAIIGEADEDISGMVQTSPAQATQKAETKPEPAPAAEPVAEPKTKAATAAVDSSRQDTAPGGNGRRTDGAPAERLIVSPLAARMAAEAGVDLRSLSGSGPGGRIVKRDIEAAMSQGKAGSAAAPSEAPQRHLRAVETKFQQLAV
ncbi:MAG: biotin/lipoyl-containing protein, partial [Pyrinomonadaceae bacterium]